MHSRGLKMLAVDQSRATFNPLTPIGHATLYLILILAPSSVGGYFEEITSLNVSTWNFTWKVKPESPFHPTDTSPLRAKQLSSFQRLTPQSPAERQPNAPVASSTLRPHPSLTPRSGNRRSGIRSRESQRSSSPSSDPSPLTSTETDFQSGRKPAPNPTERTAGWR